MRNGDACFNDRTFFFTSIRFYCSEQEYCNYHSKSRGAVFRRRGKTILLFIVYDEANIQADCIFLYILTLNIDCKTAMTHIYVIILEHKG